MEMPDFWDRLRKIKHLVKWTIIYSRFNAPIGMADSAINIVDSTKKNHP